MTDNSTTTQPTTTQTSERRCEGCGRPVHGRPDKRHCTPRCRANTRRQHRREQVGKLVSTLHDALRELTALVTKE